MFICDMCNALYPDEPCPRAAECDWRQLLLEESGIDAADVAPVAHGRWEETDMVEVDNHGETYRIPNAGKRCPWCMCVFDKKLLWRDSYCPNCGARMDGWE